MAGSDSDSESDFCDHESGRPTTADPLQSTVPGKTGIEVADKDERSLGQGPRGGAQRGDSHSSHSEPLPDHGADSGTGPASLAAHAAGASNTGKRFGPPGQGANRPVCRPDQPTNKGIRSGNAGGPLAERPISGAFTPGRGDPAGARRGDIPPAGVHPGPEGQTYERPAFPPKPPKGEGKGEKNQKGKGGGKEPRPKVYPSKPGTEEGKKWLTRQVRGRLQETGRRQLCRPYGRDGRPM